MKKIIYLSAFALLLSSCGGKSAAEKDAEAVCDCMSKAKTGSTEEKLKCLGLQRELGGKYLKDPEGMRKFNEVLNPCLIEYLGQ